MRVECDIHVETKKPGDYKLHWINLVCANTLVNAVKLVQVLITLVNVAITLVKVIIILVHVVITLINVIIMLVNV